MHLAALFSVTVDSLSLCLNVKLKDDQIKVIRSQFIRFGKFQPRLYKTVSKDEAR
jgi:hypothetical protein